MTQALALSLPIAQGDAADEGFKIIVAMLVVGLVFVSVVALGELLDHLRARRR